MKIVFITDVTPTAENVMGASALPYHLMIYRDKSVSISIYSFNNNKIEKAKIELIKTKLNCNIHILQQPLWVKCILKFKLSFLRIFLIYPIFNYIKIDKNTISKIITESPDGIWIYGQENSRIERQLSKYKICHLLPDSQSLYYYRMLGRQFVYANWYNYIKNIIMYRKYLRMEHEYISSDNVKYLLVGKEDTCFIKNNNNSINASFILHPHYEVSTKLIIKFHEPKIKVLIAGQYNLYMKQEADELLEELMNSRIEELKEHYVFTFLGKGWEKHVETMKEVGYEVEHIKFAPDYIEEIVKHDIQITPISIGTGTKGKVLDALANGLMVIGTPYAMENIAVEHGKSCIVYEHPDEVIDTLLEIPKNIQKYEEIAAEGQRQVLLHHDRKSLSKELFSYFNR